MLTSGGRECVIVADGSVMFKDDAVRVAGRWYRPGTEPKSSEQSAPAPTSTKEVPAKPAAGGSAKGDGKPAG